LEILKKEDLEEVKGGGLGIKTIMAIVSAGAFVIGLVDGFIRPLKCRNYYN